MKSPARISTMRPSTLLQCPRTLLSTWMDIRGSGDTWSGRVDGERKDLMPSTREVEGSASDYESCHSEVEDTCSSEASVLLSCSGVVLPLQSWSSQEIYGRPWTFWSIFETEDHCKTPVVLQASVQMSQSMLARFATPSMAYNENHQMVVDSVIRPFTRMAMCFSMQMSSITNGALNRNRNFLGRIRNLA